MDSVYIETTIVSYLTARPSRNVVRHAHQLLTQKWWRESRKRFDLYTSAFTLGEASAGDAKAAATRMRALKRIPLLPYSSDVTDLAERLARELKLPQRARIDAAHVAVAATNAGFVAPRILTPEMLMELP
jgi:predicted nucleic acid-binding protein